LHYNYEDATLYNNWFTGYYVTRILRYVTAIQSKRFCKCPSIVGMATHESEVIVPGDINVMGIYGPGIGDKKG
jgi:hypothetical protein